MGFGMMNDDTKAHFRATEKVAIWAGLRKREAMLCRLIPPYKMPYSQKLKVQRRCTCTFKHCLFPLTSSSTMALKHSSLVSGICDFPIGCGPYPNLNPKPQSHFGPSTDYEPFEDLDDLDEITGNSPNKKPGLDSEKFGSGSKGKASVSRHFPLGCGTGVSGYCKEEEEPDYPDWFGMIDFEEHNPENQDPVSCPSSNLVGGGLDKDAGLDPEKPGFGLRNPAHIQESAKKSGGVGIVLALRAPQFCPWRGRKGKLKKGRSAK